ncbi:MAG: lipoyl synthase [Phycisphaerales bacterium]|nr:lipoyl synthase [Phycisphaerales bacterium]
MAPHATSPEPLPLVPDAVRPVDPKAPSAAERFARTLARHPRALGGDTARSIGPAVVSLTGQVLNNRDAPAQHLRIGRKPDWLRARAPGGEGYLRTKSLIDEHRLHTVCQEASCPNIGECWARGAATIMILGDTCTRACGFCNVKTGRPGAADLDEPRRVASSLQRIGLRHVVITSVDRDDLPDGGAQLWADTILLSRGACPDMSIEVLTPDFKGDKASCATVFAAEPDIFAHNMETVERMHAVVRPQARYDRSLSVLRWARDAGLIVKTGIMVGIGERDEEVIDVMKAVRDRTEADIFTIGQYLQPTSNHLPIARWVHPDTFEWYREEGLKLGFRVVESGPLVRSSYHADEQAERLAPEERRVHESMRELLAEARDKRG